MVIDEDNKKEWQSATSIAKKKAEPESRFAILIGFYNVPACKMLARLLMHLLLLILYGSFLLVSPNLRQVMDDWNREGWQQPVVHWQLVLLMIWSAGIFLDEQQQIFKKQEMASHGFENDGQIFKMPTMVKALSSPFERFIDIGQRLLFISCTLRLMSLYSPDSISGAVLYAASLWLFNLDVVLVTFELMSFLATLSENVGVLVIMLQEMVTDVLNFFMVLPIIVIAFSLSFLGFNESTFLPSPENITESWSFMRRLTVTSMDRSPGEDDGSLDGFEKSSLYFLSLFKGPVWALLGDFEKSDDLYDSSVYASTLLWVYVLISNVVFVNILVAMFNDTYTRVKKGSGNEYAIQRMQRVFTFAQVLYPLPPPLSLPFLWRTFAHCCYKTSSFLWHLFRFDLVMAKFSRKPLKYQETPDSRSHSGPDSQEQDPSPKHQIPRNKAVDTMVRQFLRRYLKMEAEGGESILASALGKQVDKLGKELGQKLEAHRPWRREAQRAEQQIPLQRAVTAPSGSMEEFVRSESLDAKDLKQFGQTQEGIKPHQEKTEGTLADLKTQMQANTATIEVTVVKMEEKLGMVLEQQSATIEAKEVKVVKMEEKLGRFLEQQSATIEAKFSANDAKVAKVEEKLDQILKLLTATEARDDGAAPTEDLDTKPSRKSIMRKMSSSKLASASYSVRRSSHHNVDDLGKPLEDSYRLDSSGALTKQLTIGGREMPSVLPKPATRDATGTLVLGTQ